jgi:hypothetical protein
MIIINNPAAGWTDYMDRLGRFDWRQFPIEVDDAKARDEVISAMRTGPRPVMS